MNENEGSDQIRELMIHACGYGFTTSSFELQKYGTKIETSTPPSSTDIIADQLSACRIIWAMTSQPRPVNHWLFYAYGHEDMSDYKWHENRLVFLLVEPQDERSAAIGRMVLADYKKRAIGQPGVPDEIKETLVGKKEYRRWWKRKYDLYLDQLKHFDNSGIDGVCDCINYRIDNNAA